MPLPMGALGLAEREEVTRAVVAGQSRRSIAAQLGRAPSTISREIKRNGGQECYRASQATSRPGIADGAPRPVDWQQTEALASWPPSSDCRSLAMILSVTYAPTAPREPLR